MSAAAAIHRPPVVRWGILGPGNIAANFAAGLAEVPEAQLVAIGGRNSERLTRFGDRWGVPAPARHDSYEALVADPNVDAVYVATPHSFHLRHGLLVLRAGKALLVEKPAGLNQTEVATLIAEARASGSFFMEAYKCRCHPQMRIMTDLIRAGRIGTVHRIEASYGFTARADPSSRLFDPALGGGAILDIGGYTLAAARLVAGAARGLPFAEPLHLQGERIIGATGVDESATAQLDFGDGLVAELSCSITQSLPNRLLVIGSTGQILLPDPWTPGRNGGPSDSRIDVSGRTTGETIHYRDRRHLFAYEVAMACAPIQKGHSAPAFPAMADEDSIGNARASDLWRVSPSRPPPSNAGATSPET
jgi:predicted dehydrogenase